MSKRAHFEAVIFDMDGVLVDSEPLWLETETAVFASLGITVTSADYRQTMGLRTDEVVAYHFAKRPWTAPAPDEVVSIIEAEVGRKIQTRGVLFPGVHEALRLAKSRQCKIGLASSSSVAMISLVLKHFKLEDKFAAIASAEHETHGKPHPAVYLQAATKLGVHPTKCLAIEDSVNGIIAARAAKMKVVAVNADPKPEFTLARHALLSLTEFTDSMLVVHRS